MMTTTTAWSTTASAIERIEECYTSNAEEADTRLWFHVKHSGGQKKLLFSPDTDVYHIGLTAANLTTNDIIIQLNAIGRVISCCI